MNESVRQTPPHESATARSGGLATLFVSLAFLFFHGALTHIFGAEEGSEGSALRNLYLPVALSIQLISIGFLLVPWRRREVLRLLGRNIPLLLALGVIVASSTWSQDSALTLRRSLALIGTTAVGLLLYIEIGRDRLLRFFAINLAAFTVASITFSLVMPELGTHVVGRFAGQWRGLLSFKNQAAWSAVIFLLLWIGLKKSGGLRPWSLALITSGVIMLVMSNSATGYAASIFGIASYIVVHTYCANRTARPVIAVTLVTLLLAVALNFQSVFASALNLLGRDASLTGRTSIWMALWPLIESRLWLGSGYLAFWENAADYFGASNWMTFSGHAHNAYVEILLDVGLVGLASQLVFLLTLHWKLWQGVVRGDRTAATMFLILLTLSVIGIAGALFFRANTSIWLIIVAFACYAADSGGRVEQEVQSYRWLQ